MLCMGDEPVNTAVTGVCMHVYLLWLLFMEGREVAYSAYMAVRAPLSLTPLAPSSSSRSSDR